MIRLIWFFIILIIMQSSNAYAERYHAYRVVLHVHTDASGEKTTLDEIGYVARSQNVDAVILTDYFQQKASLLPRTVPEWLRFSYQKSSVKRQGVRDYISSINDFRIVNSAPLLIGGVEITPSYYWTGNILKGDLTVHDLQKNLLVFGLKEKQLDLLPTAENRNPTFDPWNSAANITDYQRVIDFIEANGGISVWSTPDESHGAEFQKGPLTFYTPPYAEFVRMTKNFTAVAIFPEGFTETGIVGGHWDQMLMQYIEGTRDSAPWGISESIVHDDRVIRQFAIYDNIVFAPRLSEEAIVRSISEGKYYFRRIQEDPMFLSRFELQDRESKEFYRSGQELEGSMMPTLHVQIKMPENSQAEQIRLDVIRNGKLVYSEKRNTRDFELTYEDEDDIRIGERVYYRVLAHSAYNKNSYVMSNPVFFRRK